MNAGTGDGQSRRGEVGEFGHGGGCADEVEHCGGGNFERCGAEWEGEDGSEMILVL